MKDRLVILLGESEGKKPTIHIYTDGFDKVLESFKNCSATTSNDKARMTLVDVRYEGDIAKSMVAVKLLPKKTLEKKPEGYKIGRPAKSKKLFLKKILERIKKWLAKLI